MKDPVEQYGEGDPRIAGVIVGLIMAVLSALPVFGFSLTPEQIEAVAKILVAIVALTGAASSYFQGRRSFKPETVKALLEAQKDQLNEQLLDPDVEDET